MNDLALTKLDAAQHALAECKTVMEAKEIADAAEAARVYLARTNASVATVNRAAEIRTLAERQMGEFLARMPNAPTGPRKEELGSQAELNSVPSLRDLGISKKQSATSQKLAAIPASEFRERVALVKASGGTPSAVTVLKFSPAKPRGSRFKMPAVGLLIARGAIRQLETILPKDGERTAALEMVRDWCDEQLRISPSCAEVLQLLPATPAVSAGAGTIVAASAGSLPPSKINHRTKNTQNLPREE